VTADAGSRLDDVEDASADEGAVTPKDDVAPEPEAAPARRWIRLPWARIGYIALAVVAVSSVALAAWLYWYQYRPDRQTDADAKHAVVSAASDGAVAILSYSPESLDHDFSSAKSHLTGDFLSYYDQFTRQIVTPAAKQKGVKTTAAVVGAAVSELHPDSAVVLVFVNQSTTAADRPAPSLASSSVLVKLTKVNGTWLISEFDPV
jgi:Mce-associated membrane protein